MVSREESGWGAVKGEENCKSYKCTVIIFKFFLFPFSFFTFLSILYTSNIQLFYNLFFSPFFYSFKFMAFLSSSFTVYISVCRSGQRVATPAPAPPEATADALLHFNVPAASRTFRQLSAGWKTTRMSFSCPPRTRSSGVSGNDLLSQRNYFQSPQRSLVGFRNVPFVDKVEIFLSLESPPQKNLKTCATEIIGRFLVCFCCL